MIINNLTHEQVDGFIDCFVRVFYTMKGILPDDYVEKGVKRAISLEFRENLLEKIDSLNEILLVSNIEGNVIGHAWGRIKDDTSSWLGSIGVLPEYRRNGYGRALLKTFIEECVEKGSRKIGLNTHPDLVAARNLYESMGFIEEGYVTNPYGLRLIIYRKNIRMQVR